MGGSGLWWTQAGALPQGALIDAQPDEAGDGLQLEALLAHVTCTVLRAGCWLPVPSDWQLRQAVSPHYVALICVGGAADYVFDGQPHAVEKGGVLLVPPRLVREGRHDPAHPLHLYAVHFQARLYGVLDMPAAYRLPVAYRPTPERMDAIVRLAQGIVGEFARREAGYVLAANAACAQIVSLIWREASSGGASPSGLASPRRVARLAPVFGIIQARFAEVLTLEQLAEAVHLHPAYFSTVFRQTVGLPPLRYLAHYRLDRVRELLLSTDLPVSAIAARTGFLDPTYLNRVFRRAEGITPTAYRRSKKNPTFP